MTRALLLIAEMTCHDLRFTIHAHLMNLYAYCLSDEISDDVIEQIIGIAGARVRLIEIGEIRAVVSRIDGERAEVTRENVLAHEKVNRHVLAHTTPLPFRFGTVVSQSQLERYIVSCREQIFAQLSNVRGAVEMSVKIIWDVESHKGAAMSESENSRSDKATGPGAAFLARKQREIQASEAMKKEAEAIALWLRQQVGDAARDALVEVRPTEAIVIVAAHLVERSRIEDYRSRIRVARDERADLRFLTSGAWPPYSFCALSRKDT